MKKFVTSKNPISLIQPNQEQINFLTSATREKQKELTETKIRNHPCYFIAVGFLFTNILCFACVFTLYVFNSLASRF